MPLQFGGAPICHRCKKVVYMPEQVTGPGGAWHKTCLTCKECNKRLDSTILTERDHEAYCKTCYQRLWGPKGYGFAGGAAFLSTETMLPAEVLEMKKHEFTPQPNNPASQQTSSPSYPPAEMQRPSPTTAALPPRPAQLPRPAEFARPAVPVEPLRPAEPPRPAEIPSPSPEQLPVLPVRLNPESMTSFWSSSGSSVLSRQKFVPKNEYCHKCKKPVYAAEQVLGAGFKYHKACLKCQECSTSLNSSNMRDRDSVLYCQKCYSKGFGPKGFGYNNLLTTEGSTR